MAHDSEPPEGVVVYLGCDEENCDFRTALFFSPSEFTAKLSAGVLDGWIVNATGEELRYTCPRCVAVWATLDVCRKQLRL